MILTNHERKALTTIDTLILIIAYFFYKIQDLVLKFLPNIHKFTHNSL